ncbi:DUF2249 domain-containing protein [Vogesella sp. DC21W]|uniref:DUF2249 domain-containing protein n=1 Tax=Vogesella aquatica TaxID=2984206 RepID=A0ABT5IVS3_9NEIS|nr:DUF2249 domain-containing protein [Vogesella aquatica]MDC7716678.1 DUF2249 domain-containing protein [Vogesella aquatica]
MQDTQQPNHFVFDARGVAKRFRHAAIFGALEQLHRGEVMRFINDHEPLPLLQQISQRYQHQVQIVAVSQQPGEVVFDFSVFPAGADEDEATPPASGGSCGGGGGGCGCSGG